MIDLGRILGMDMDMKEEQGQTDLMLQKAL